MDLLSQRAFILEGIENMKRATEAAVRLKFSNDPEIAELAKAVHFLSYGAQQIGLALTDEGREKNLNV